MSLLFNSRRSPVYATHGMVSTSQPLASQAGLSILQKGGTAADAAVAAAAVLNLTEPGSTGIGGDMFLLYYDARTMQVSALNGSGRAPADITIERVERDGLRTGDAISDPFHAHCVTVPGACSGWSETLKRHGRMSFADVLAPAIQLAEEGFPVAPLTSAAWQLGAERQLGLKQRGDELTIGGRAPYAGDRFKNPGLARTFRVVAEGGAEAFYTGEIAKKIVAAVQKFGGVMTLADLAAHRVTDEPAISTTYRGVRVWECPPNGQGLTALIALNILEGFDLDGGALSAERLHLVIEALRLAFADARWFIADPATNPAPLEALLSKTYATARRKLIHRTKANADQKAGRPIAGTDTVYFCVVDGEGNAASFINSNYMGFGTGIVPGGTGFALQNRGHNFSLNREHPNALAPGKRPYHTIIPAMLTRDMTPPGPRSRKGANAPLPMHELVGPFGVMGGFMQPQGHVQVVINLIDDALDPQSALDRPRVSLDDGTPDSRVAIEDGIGFDVAAKLAGMGHNVMPVSIASRSVFGRGQIIMRNKDNAVLCAGSDPRADGCAVGW